MNNIIVVLNKKEDIVEVLKKDIKGIIIGAKGLSTYNLELEIGDIINISNSTDKKIIIAMNRMIHNRDIDKVKDVLKMIKNTSISSILFYDVGILKLAKEMNINKELIIGQEHLNASINSNNFYYRNGVNSTYITSDITCDELLDIKRNTKLDVYYTVYGKLQIFYSRRKLLSSYFEYIEKDMTDNTYYIYDNDKKYTIVENGYGTIIYSPVVNLINHISQLNDINLVIDLSLQDGIDIIDKFINKEEALEDYLGFYNTKTTYKVKGDKND